MTMLPIDIAKLMLASGVLGSNRDIESSAG